MEVRKSQITAMEGVYCISYQSQVSGGSCIDRVDNIIMERHQRINKRFI